ncbi:1-phosphofructokinase family hexose kinase [Actinomadura scrupuli]|uniref:1-phosphofructokinase family hexose kinase n=1 Tax=Actinomadura scrupuli TaxID=559629 RepID=UPI003D96EE7A
MFLTVTLNAALDVTYEVRRLAPGAVHRVAAPAARAGGKGINVARVLHALGEPVRVTGFAGGPAGEALRADLAAAAVPADLVPMAGETRRTVTVVETGTGEATLLNEPGPHVTAAEWRTFLGRFGELAAQARVVVLSGSLPPGVPGDAYAVLTRAAGAVPVLLDTSGAALLEGARARPGLVKPNTAELSAATGHTDPRHGAAALRDLGARAVVVSQGADGMSAFTGGGAWRAVCPEPVTGNPTGAGDAAVAALARGLATGSPWPERLTDAVALSAAAVAAPLAGDVDHGRYARLLPLVQIEPLPGEPLPGRAGSGAAPSGGPLSRRTPEQRTHLS